MASSRGVRCIWTWGQPAREGVEVGTEAKGECPTKSLFPLKSAHVAHRTLGRSRALPPICLCGSITAQLDASACGNALIGSPSPPCRTAMNRGPIVLTIDEAEYLLDQLPPPSSDEDQIATKLRKRLQDLLTDLRSNAEGTAKSG